ncbi:protein LCHN-like [Arapaima gigas]
MESLTREVQKFVTAENDKIPERVYFADMREEDVPQRRKILSGGDISGAPKADSIPHFLLLRILDHYIYETFCVSMANTSNRSKLVWTLGILVQETIISAPKSEELLKKFGKLWDLQEGLKVTEDIAKKIGHLLCSECGIPGPSHRHQNMKSLLNNMRLCEELSITIAEKLLEYLDAYTIERNAETQSHLLRNIECDIRVHPLMVFSETEGQGTECQRRLGFRGSLRKVLKAFKSHSLLLQSLRTPS